MGEYISNMKEPDEYVSRDSRYRRLKVLEGKDRVEIFQTWKRLDIPVSNEDNYHEVQKKEEYRLDLIAKSYYRNDKLWWIIAIANNINNPLDIEVGQILRIPSISTLYGYEGVL